MINHIPTPTIINKKAKTQRKKGKRGKRRVISR